MGNNLFAANALAQIPKLLTLLDRNRHSATYGCFDRNFWHYKIIDFPSGMAQEFVWPLALAHEMPHPENVFYKSPAIREWVEAGILYAARSAHPDGSCDDYFPFEKAGGAAAFSLLACAESYALLGLENSEALTFFEKRAGWLAHHHESGQLTNHQALIVSCIDCVSALLRTNRWASAREERLERVLAWQNSEGWFQEYEGADPGYHTLTISLLAGIYERTPSPRIHQALERAVKFAAEFIHPDGSFGGEYSSRNTYNFFPHGFELFGRHMPEALAVNDLFLEGLSKGLGPCYADDHIIGHHTWNYLLAARSFVAERPARKARMQGRVHFPQAGLLIDRRGTCELYVALNKGGTFRFFREGACVASDTGLSLLIGKRTAVMHLIGNYPHTIDEEVLAVHGNLGWAKHKAMTPLRLVALRAVMLCGGRFFPNLVRKLLQKLLITGKSDAPFRFERTLRWKDQKLSIHDRIEGEDWTSVDHAAIGGDQTSIYVVMSRTFQATQLQPWKDLTPLLRRLKPGEALECEREL